MIKSLLIANRGEIARRIARTARAMGVRVIAVYSDEDEHAPHVLEADEEVRLGPAPARDSYLKMDLILEAAKQTGAEAIHPGYGFLSENAEFADACKEAGIIFVGPPASAIRAMGRKDEAKKIMDAAGVPITPGYMGDDQSDETLAREGGKTGYPLLIKAVSGGGGKGMRRVDEASEFQGALEAARREASSAFGDDRVLLEKFIENPRHVEVQIFGDSHGGAVHFFERDCSLQRRHQKVIEEAPAPGMSTAVREAICAAAVEAARAVGYEGAGTVEFIADGSGDLRADGFWFMEMNTRLQVEHPVTEMVTNTDLVALQLHVAAGGSVPDQSEITLNGHAVEARLYAEDPSTGFLPSTGDLDWLRLPQGESVRVDSGVEEGGAVSIHYDPMIAKIIAHAPTREAAVARLADAVERVEVLGVKTNAGFLARTLRRPEFIEGGVDTGFIGRHIDTLSGTAHYTAAAAPIAAALSLDMRRERAEERALAAGEDNSPWTLMDGFRVNQTPRLGVAFMIEGERKEVALSPHRGGYVWRHGDEATPLWIDRDGESFAGAFGDEAVEGRVMQTEEGMILLYRGDVLRYLSPRATVDEAIEAEGQIEAPMPGKVLEVKISAGETVTQGQTLVILEAMKMEQSLTAPRDGLAETVSVAAGDQVSEGQILVVLAEQADEAA